MKIETVLLIIQILLTILSPFIFYIISLLFIKFRYRLKPIKKYKDNFIKPKDELNRKEISKLYFDSINKFNKEKLNNEKLNRFAINGPYGSGKSYLISFLEKNIINSNNYVIVFKAWESNEIYSPFENLILKIEKNKKEWFSKRISHKFKKVVRLIIKEPKFYFKTISTYVYKYDFIKHVFWEIDQFLKKKNKKIYILIDEIDRCNSSDSLEFLEITNQLFENLDNIISIYSYDKENLMATISNKMGAINKKTFLNKFFDHEFELKNKSYEYIIAKIKDVNNKHLNIFSPIVEDKFNLIKDKSINLSLREINLKFNQILNIQKFYKNKEFSNVLSVYFFIKEFFGLEVLDIKSFKIYLKKWKLSNVSIFDFELFFNETNIYIEDENKLLIDEWKDFIYLVNTQKGLEFSNSKLFIKFNFLEIQTEGFEKYFTSSFNQWNSGWTYLNSNQSKTENKVLYSNVEKILINLFVNEKLKNKNFYKEDSKKVKEMNNWIFKLSEAKKIPFFDRYRHGSNPANFTNSLKAMDTIVDEKFFKGESTHLKVLNGEIKDFYDKEIKKHFVNSK